MSFPPIQGTADELTADTAEQAGAVELWAVGAMGDVENRREVGPR
jgi:hypothetical protein